MNENTMYCTMYCEDPKIFELRQQLAESQRREKRLAIENELLDEQLKRCLETLQEHGLVEKAALRVRTVSRHLP